MITDYRAELQKLVQAYDDHGGRWPQHHEAALFNAVEVARAALAQPEPAGPTDEEINDLADEWWPMDRVDVCHFARAVLARWGRPTPQPIPVSERLPSDEDSDANGRCWAWNPESLWWDYWRPKFIRMNAGDPYTHWLPGGALPLPTTEP